jgi:hypothetical protein
VQNESRYVHFVIEIGIRIHMSRGSLEGVPINNPLSRATKLRIQVLTPPPRPLGGQVQQDEGRVVAGNDPHGICKTSDLD